MVSFIVLKPLCLSVLTRTGGRLRCFGVLLEKQVLGKVHGYDEISGSQINLPRAARLDANLFQGTPGTSSLKLSDIIGNQPKPHWYSAKPEDCQGKVNTYPAY